MRKEGERIAITLTVQEYCEGYVSRSLKVEELSKKQGIIP